MSKLKFPKECREFCRKYIVSRKRILYIIFESVTQYKVYNISNNSIS